MSLIFSFLRGSKVRLAEIGLLASIAIFSLHANAGNSDRGGSLVFKGAPSEQILLDFVQVNPNFRETRFDKKARIQVRRGSLKLGYGNLDLKNWSVMQKVEARLDLWSKNSPKTVASLRKALKGMDLRYTPYSVRVNSDYYLPPVLGDAFDTDKLQPAVVYMGGGAYLSAPVWNGLGEVTQTGIIIHEGFRHLQDKYGLKAEALQWMTAKITLTSPGQDHELDQKSIWPPHFFDPEIYAKLRGIYVLDNFCQKLSSRSFAKSATKLALCQPWTTADAPGPRLAAQQLLRLSKEYQIGGKTGDEAVSWEALELASGFLGAAGEVTIAEFYEKSALEKAKALSELANQISDYNLSYFNELPAGERLELQRLSSFARSESNVFSDLSIGYAMGKLGDSLRKLEYASAASFIDSTIMDLAEGKNPFKWNTSSQTRMQIERMLQWYISQTQERLKEGILYK